MKKHNFITGSLAAIFLISSLFIVGCKKEEQVVKPPLPENEFITTIKLTLIDTLSNDTLLAKWKDISPEDSNPADTSLAILSLKSNRFYKAEITLFDETKNPTVDITNEVKERSIYHLFFYYPSASLNGNLIVNITDSDLNNPPLPLGVSTNFITNSPSSGSLNVILRHQPKGKNGTFAPGTTDVDVRFRVTITD
jgi:hypothetical protein